MREDAGARTERDASVPEACPEVVIDGDRVEVHEENLTARFSIVESFTKTVMLFGGKVVAFENAVSSVGIIALDQADAVKLAEKYPDFYLCSSEGGMEAQDYIVQFDLVPATCEIHQQLAAALEDLERNNRAGGDRPSLIFDGALLALESATFDDSGQDIKDHFAELNFQLVTKVKQISGQSLLDFGAQ